MATAPTQTVLWSPQEGPQTALLECPVFEVFYGGARGGGKTESSIGDWLQHSSLYGEHAIGIFVRRKLTQLAEVIARTKQIFPKLGGRYNEQQKTWTMGNGARLKFVYLERDSDAEEYQGHSYTRIYVEEVTNFPSPSPINKLKATLRSGAGVPTGMRLTGNPGGPGHNWVKARYINPNPKGYQVITEQEELLIDDRKVTVTLDRVFIPSKLGDNMLLMRNDPTYVLRLRASGSEQLVKAWLEGNWDIVDGAFFDEFSEDLHVKPASYINFATPQTIRFRSFDWGSAKPFSVGWYTICDGLWPLFDPFPKGSIFKYREWYGAKGPNVGLKMTANEVEGGVIGPDKKRISNGILQMEEGERIRYAVADPSIFIRNGGPSINESMAKCKWRKADNKRQPGWEAIRQRLVGIERKPMLYFSDSCEDTIRTLPVLQHEENDPEDLDTDAEDHAADELRYAVMSRPWTPAPPINPIPDIGSVLQKGMLKSLTLNQMISQNTARRRAKEW